VQDVVGGGQRSGWGSFVVLAGEGPQGRAVGVAFFGEAGVDLAAVVITFRRRARPYRKVVPSASTGAHVPLVVR
jgi:hypothetical protein